MKDENEMEIFINQMEQWTQKMERFTIMNEVFDFHIN